MLFFLPLAFYTTRYTRFVEFVTIETHTASTVMMGYIYGSLVGVVSGFCLSTWAYLGNGIAKLRAYLDIFYTIFAGYAAGYLETKGFSFPVAFSLAIIIKNSISLILNHLFFDPDKLSNLMYRVTHVFLNVFIYSLFFTALYDIVKVF
ncbi:hypothetical protein GF327_07535 [Candidatus Woesearchaeota archaeon]|nr:hypothetical protein [Candidatus Woesearchaeota archaeon]MBD3283357.1 hypothetical protein [Candidatus Pacearchaeota archaeon]